MGDVVGDFAQARHELLNALEHRVQVGGEPVEFIVRAADRQACGEVSLHDGLGAFVHGVDAAQHTARNEEASEHADERDPEQRGDERPAEDAGDGFAVLEIAAYKQAKAARQHEDADQRAALDARFAHALIRRFAQARRTKHIRRQVENVAGDSLPLEVGDEVQRGAGLARTAFDDVDEAAHAALPVEVGESLDLRLDGGLDLLVHDAAHVPCDPRHDDAGEDREHHEIGE